MYYNMRVIALLANRFLRLLATPCHFNPQYSNIQISSTPASTPAWAWQLHSHAHAHDPFQDNSHTL